ncbi:cell division protein FtsQ/DivIB [Chachezhania sediminis]|uniref:cell division protein FtsQ/DivIB n=1 Tax=Chachezhania sediminis TaxID=2599291 RepID=UPI00131BFD09|nr:cell division protein FtsQ/DivIB [Chachezhania sediminis]
MRPLGRPEPKLKADPAPSRMKYRLQRWWLTPSIRLTLRVGLPLAIVGGTAFTILSDEVRRNRVYDAVMDARAVVSERPEFRVGLLAVDGASPGLDRAIRDELALNLPVSSFDLNIDTLRQQIEAMPSVEFAGVRIRAGGVLQVEVKERVPVAVWRSEDGLKLIDKTGAATLTVALRSEHPELPLIAGAGADRVVPEAMALIAAAHPLDDRLRGLVRVGERRWDMVLDRGQRIMLPERDFVPALERVLALDSARDLLARDVTVVDMRLGERPTIRMAEAAVGELQRIRTLNGTKP